jgi:hypothetical protein
MARIPDIHFTYTSPSTGVTIEIRQHAYINDKSKSHVTLQFSDISDPVFKNLEGQFFGPFGRRFSNVDSDKRCLYFTAPRTDFSRTIPNILSGIGVMSMEEGVAWARMYENQPILAKMPDLMDRTNRALELRNMPPLAYELKPSGVLECWLPTRDTVADKQHDIEVKAALGELRRRTGRLHSGQFLLRDGENIHDLAQDGAKFRNPQKTASAAL